jgi:hypothetical protein
MINQIEKLKQYVIKYAETYLKEFGEFYPFGFTVDKQENVKPFDIYFGEEHPASSDVIENLEKAYKTLVETNQNEYKIISICSDVLVIPPYSENKIDALEIRINYLPNECINYYVPYKRNEDGTILFLKEYSEAGTLNIINEQNKINLTQTAITSRYIIKDKLPILYVVHEDTDEWQFLGGQDVEEKDIMIVSMQNIIEHDETIRKILHLPLGSEAIRKDKISEWRIITKN